MFDDFQNFFLKIFTFNSRSWLAMLEQTITIKFTSSKSLVIFTFSRMSHYAYSSSAINCFTNSFNMSVATLISKFAISILIKLADSFHRHHLLFLNSEFSISQYFIKHMHGVKLTAIHMGKKLISCRSESSKIILVV